MTFKPRHDFLPCVPGAFAGGLRRTEFFDGMVLSEADMKREQSYWQMKRRLTNRALGQGVVWGLNLAWNPRTRCFTICPGYGISCCGDDLVVECPEEVCEGDLIDVCSEEFRRLFADALDPCGCEKPDRPVRACLLLEYVECPEDPRQVFEDPCAETPRGCRFGAVRETVRLRLVPPPPPPPKGPVERFCRKIEQIREEMAKAAAEAGEPTPPDPMFDPSLAQARLTASPLDANDVSMGGKTVEIETVADAHAELVLESDTSDEVKLTIEPMPGYVFTSVAQKGFGETRAETMMGWVTTQSEEALRTGMRKELVVEMAPLLTGSPAMRASYVLTATRADNVTRAEVAVTEVEMLERDRDCTSIFDDGLFLTADPACLIRTLVLAVLCGWFRGQLGAAPCDGREDEEVDPARAAIAWLVCWVAWRLLWGIDTTKSGGKGAEACLRKLFAEWCDGVHYRGPRCEHDVHGIILGCVEVSPKGRILCFDEWAHRRYVLTGPLLTHWAGQFGIAPIDVAATRLASWICCVAEAPMPEMPGDQLGQVAGNFSFSSGSVLVGGDVAPGARLGSATVNSVRPVGSATLVQRLLAILVQDGQPALSTAASVDVFSLPGGDLHLVLPRSSASIRPQQAEIAVAAELAPQIEAAPHMARRPMAEFVDTMAREVPLASLSNPTESALFEPLVKALEAEEIASLADLVSLGPDRALDRVRPVLARADGFTDEAVADKAMALVYTSAVRTLRDTAEAIVAEAKDRSEDEAFVRADLTATSTTSAIRRAVNQNLQGRGLTASNVRDLAARVAKRS